MGSNESDLTSIENLATVLDGIAGIFGGITAELGLVAFFGEGGST